MKSSRNVGQPDKVQAPFPQETHKSDTLIHRIGLLLRSVMNLVAFGMFWYGLAEHTERLGLICLGAGGMLTCVCLWQNFFLPLGTALRRYFPFR